MTGCGDRDPRIAELLERHTPAQDGEPDWDRVTGRTRRRRVRSGVFAAAGFTATAAVVAGLFLFPPDRGTDTSRVPAYPGVFGERPQDGVAMRIAVEPHPGSGLSPRRAAEVTDAALRQNARRNGYAALVRPAGGNLLDVWVPRARWSRDIAELRTWSLAVYDVRNPVARSRDAGTILRAAERLPPTRGVWHYLADDELGVVGPDASAEAVAAVVRRSKGDRAGTGPVPAGATLHRVPRDHVVVSAGGEYLLLRDRPLVRPQDIIGAEGDASPLTLTLTRTGTVSWSGASARSNAALVVWLPGDVNSGRVVGRVVGGSRSPRVAVTPDIPFLVDLLRRYTRAPASMRVVAERATGDRVRAGSAEAPPALLREQAEADGVDSSTLLRVLRFTTEEGGRSLWTGLTEEGAELVTVVGDAGSVGWFRRCEPEPGTPAVACDNTAGVVVGRVRPDATRIDGPGVRMADGWFVMTGPPNRRYRVLGPAGARIGLLDPNALQAP